MRCCPCRVVPNLTCRQVTVSGEVGLDWRAGGWVSEWWREGYLDEEDDMLFDAFTGPHLNASLGPAEHCHVHVQVV